MICWYSQRANGRDLGNLQDGISITRVMEAAIFRPAILSISRHKIEFKLNQIKDHLMNTVEATCRGDPGAVYLTSTVRQASFATQGKNFITKASILESLHTFENEKRHIHRVFWTDRLDS